MMLVGSLKIGETEKVARQHDATQTQEAAPLPPMQSAHIHGNSSSNGLTAKADSGLARHEHHRSERTQSLVKAHMNSNKVILAKYTSKSTTTSQVKRNQQARNVQWNVYRSEAGA